MSPIYTKTGDSGETGLFGGGRVGKDDPRVAAYGEVDELNATIGFARSHGMDPELDALARRLQEELFTVGAVLATPQGSKAEQHIPKVRAEWVKAMEDAIDAFDKELPAMDSFILPGGGPAASSLHLARTVCRRAERRAVPLYRAGKIELLVISYLNRLSDLLFTMARAANHRAKIQDVKWVPPRG
ncbi:MAG TPA: cob(I)yrinic acid a,c-diamide adenosyltransferase [Myxococcales bacterium]|jgi:cob(I)alamin adenosyltransferase|nr:cob(I)yrinic acid a,c-diamide adenosyltransferase [Myxococcales bacterium]